MERGKSMQPYVKYPVSKAGRFESDDFFSEAHKFANGAIQRFGMGFGKHDFFSGMGFNSLMNNMHQDFQNIFKFSDLHQNMFDAKNQGNYTVVSKSYVSSQKMGENGQVIKEKYMANNVAQNKNGNTISEKQQAYKNSNGIDRIGHERMLNDQGRKYVKQRNKNTRQQNQTNHYYNLDYQRQREFDNRWNQMNRHNGFLQDFGKYLGYDGLYRIQEQPRQEYKKNQFKQKPKYEPPRKKDIHPIMLGGNSNHPAIRNQQERRNQPREHLVNQRRQGMQTKSSGVGGVYKNRGIGGKPKAF